MTHEQEGIIKNSLTRSVSGLNQHDVVREIQECSKHGDAFKTGVEAPHWCNECRILLRRNSTQKPRSTKLLRLGPLPDAVNIENPDLPKSVPGHQWSELPSSDC